MSDMSLKIEAAIAKKLRQDSDVVHKSPLQRIFPKVLIAALNGDCGVQYRGRVSAKDKEYLRELGYRIEDERLKSLFIYWDH
jgi:hypothetical protein